MQSQVKTPGRPENMSIITCAKYIYKNNGLKGFYRGVTPRIGLGVWQTVCMVFGGDAIKVKYQGGPRSNEVLFTISILAYMLTVFPV